MTAPTFLLVAAIIIFAYIAALVYTGMPRPPARWTNRSLAGLNRIISGVALPSKLSRRQLFASQGGGGSARDITLPDALGWAVHGEWGKPFHVPFVTLNLGVGANTTNLLTRFTQLAREGRLTIWGKRSNPGYFEKIPQSHWRDNQLSIPDMFGSVITSGTDPYRELMLNKVEVEREWPHEG